MSFQYASIHPEGQDSFEVLFNPNEYTIDKGNQIAETAIPGLQAPILQYVHGNTCNLSMELFFDTWEEKSDVRVYTNKIYGLLGIVSSTHVPPICKIVWGGMTFEGVLEKVTGKFTLFFPDGTPARATLNVSFKEYINVEDLVKINPTQSADHRKTRVVQAGDRLSTIAYEEYDDASKWRPIADANGLRNPTQLDPGSVLVIPAIE